MYENIKVKICGITKVEDALFSEENGAWSIGYIFYQKSPRYISPEIAREISDELGPFITKTGVFVNENIDVVKKTIEKAKLNAVQFHGDETADYIENFNWITVIKGFRTDEKFKPEMLSEYNVSAFLIDSYIKNIRGGTGIKCDWLKAAQCANYGRVILAGGINSENLLDSIKNVKPYAVDISSGVEKSPGIKDKEKIKNIFNILKNRK